MGKILKWRINIDIASGINEGKITKIFPSMTFMMILIVQYENYNFFSV
jgi:hypothetical protein